MTLRVVGVGEPMAGDDAVGIRVIERLRAVGAPPDTELTALCDPSELATVLSGSDPVLIVDAVLDPGRAGSVELREWGALARQRHSISSHGVDTYTAVELAKTLSDPGDFPMVTLLTIAIEKPTRLTAALSALAELAVEEAVGRVLCWARQTARPQSDARDA